MSAVVSLPATTGYEVRPLAANERNMVFSTWLRSSARFGRAFTDKPRLFYSQHHELVERTLEVSKALVAFTADTPDLVRGYVVWEPEGPGGPLCDDEMPPVLHYLFVKERYRRSGVATALLDAALGERWKRKYVIYTHPLSRLSRSSDAGARPATPASLEGTMPQVPGPWEFCAYAFLRA